MSSITAELLIYLQNISGFYLEQNFSTHGFAVSDDGLFVAAFAIPTIELDTSTSEFGQIMLGNLRVFI